MDLVFGEMGNNWVRFLRGASSPRNSSVHRCSRVIALLQVIIISSCLISNSFVNGLVFRSEIGDSGQHGRSLIGPGGVILDIPKIRVLRYKVRNNDPNVVSDELDCDNGECGDIVEPPVNKLQLGTNSAKESNEWSVPANVTQFAIECKSRSGVVEWEYEGNGVMADIEIENTRIVGDFWASSTYLHVSTITFNRISDQLVGKYTCKNVDKTTKSNSFYLFVPQPKSHVINDGRKIEVMPPSHADEVIIPCRIDKRHTPIYLFRKGPDGNYRRVQLNNRGRFDPYLGFVLPVTPDVFGEYACKVDKKRKKKTKRDAPSLAMMPPPMQKESGASPGFSAFPNSDELADIIKTEDDVAFLASLLTSSSGEHPTVPPELAVPPVPTPHSNLTHEVQEVVQFQPYKQRKHRPFHRRRKRPFMRRRHGAAGVAANLLSRRGGPPLHSQMGQLQMPQRGSLFQHRRPVYHRSPINIGPPPNSNMMDPQGSPTASGSLSLPVILNHPLHPPHNHFHPHHTHPPIHQKFPPSATAIGVLPTFTASSSNGGLIGQNAEEKLPGSHEASQTPYLSPHQAFIAETLMSRVEGPNKSPPKQQPVKKPISLFPQNLLPPTMSVMHTMQCVLKKMVLGADVPCNASLTDGIAERHGSTTSNNNANSVTETPLPVKEQKTILEVAIIPPPANKFFPVESAIFTTAPFFVKWETRFTDYANWAEANHTLKDGAYKRHRAEEVADFENGINSLEIFDVPEGETGNITVTYMGGRKEIKTHTWHYFIINNTAASNKGLKQTVDGVVKVFMCRSATSKRPVLSLRRLTENGCPEESKDPFAGSQDYTEEDCGVGCTLLRTKIDQGVVKCLGDGIDETLMFPEEMQCTGRPYFVDRGKSKNLNLAAKGNRMLIPCVINNPNADVYLYHEEQGMMVEVTDNSTYDLKAGFYLDTGPLADPYGTYVCTSSPDAEDETDTVKYNVSPPEDYVFYPSHNTVFGVPPFKFMWESNDELEVGNASIGKFDKGMFAKADGSRPHVGTFEVFPNVTGREGSFGEVQVIRKSDRKVVHTWRFIHMNKPGLSLDKEKNLFRCQSATGDPPMLYAVPCDNPNVCKLERKYFDTEDEDIRSGRDNSQCGEGCVQLKVWKNKPLGFVRCKGDGVEETLQYFLSENSTILTEEDKSSMEQFKIPEIMNGVRRLRVGETADFICKASRYFYSKGFQWAVETKSGQKKFIDAKVREDVLVKDEIRSVISLKILDAEWKSVWCYTPELTSSQWANISQPIYLR